MSRLVFPTAILDQHLVVLGKTGAGKSSALRHIVEYLLYHKKRVCVIDPKGDWWGLKSSADGKAPGYPVIAFGDFKNEDATDVPINAKSGGHVAELITSGNRPAIIGFRGWMTSHMVEFWIDFASGIFNANSGELYLVGDEFHNFAPKGKIMDPQAGKCLHWSNRLMSEGRGLGIVCLIASQRPQKVHNDTLTSCETLVAMRVVHAADRGAVEEWIKGCGDKDAGKEVLNSLAGLARGEAFVWSPEINFGPKRLEFPMFETFDSFAPPQLQKKVSQKSWADIDLDSVKEKLATVIEEAKANDPKELRKKIAGLEKERRDTLSKLTSDKATRVEVIEKPVLKDAQIARLEKWFDRGQEFLSKIDAVALQVHTLGAEAESVIIHTREVFSKITGNGTAPQILNTTRAGAGTDGRGERVPREVKSAGSAQPGSGATGTPGGPRKSGEEGDLTRPQQRILDALATLQVLGLRDVAKSNLAVFADQSPTSSGYQNNLGRLRALGLIQYPQQGRVSLTDQGAEIASSDGSILSLADLHRAWFTKLPAPKVRILQALIAVYPDALEKAELAEKSGQSPTSSGYQNNLGNLRSLGLIDYPHQGFVAATSLLFPEGLR